MTLNHLPPFFLPTLSLASGIWLQSHAPLHAIFLIIGIGVALCTHYIPKKHLLLCVSFAVGIASATLQKSMPTLSLLSSITNADIIGTVTDYSYVPHARMKHRIVLQVKKFKTTEVPWQSTNDMIQIYVQHNPKVKIADTIHLQNVSIKQKRNTSFYDHLLRNGISSTLFITKLEPLFLERPTHNIARTLYELRATLLKALQTKLSYKTHALFASLFLGNNTATKKALEPLNEHFKYWGLMHYLARSGLHLVLFVFMWTMLLQLLPLPYTLKQTVLVILCFLYFLLSWSSTSFMRAFTTLCLYKICTFTNRPTHFLHTLSLVCFCFLLCNPIQLFFLDFQLSFGLTYALAWFNLVYRNTIPIKNVKH